MRNKWTVAGWLVAAAILGYSVAHWTTPTERVVTQQQAPAPSQPFTNTQQRQGAPGYPPYTNTQPRQDVQTQLDNQQRQINQLTSGR